MEQKLFLTYMYTFFVKKSFIFFCFPDGLLAASEVTRTVPTQKEIFADSNKAT